MLRITHTYITIHTVNLIIWNDNHGHGVGFWILPLLKKKGQKLVHLPGNGRCKNFQFGNDDVFSIEAPLPQLFIKLYRFSRKYTLLIKPNQILNKHSYSLDWL